MAEKFPTARDAGADGAGPVFASMYAWYQAFKATVMRGGVMNVPRA
jgi:hypothetical protein